MDDALTDISLVLPAYNEAAGIAEAVREADDALQQLGVRYEIIVVDDGSSDQTTAVVEAAMQHQAAPQPPPAAVCRSPASTHDSRPSRPPWPDGTWPRRRAARRGDGTESAHGSNHYRRK